MEIKTLNVKDIIPYDKNPRKNDNAVDKVAESIKQFGFKNPIIIDKNNIVVCGHTRLKAAKKLKIKEVPCIYADDLTDEQIKAFRLADNKVAELSEWDFDLLDQELDVLDLFNGSGTTIMACEQNGRNAYCMELDPRYVDAAIDRWEKFTGQKAVLLNGGETE